MPVFPVAAPAGPDASATSSLQQAVDDCHAAGGGRVVLQGGVTYTAGTVHLKSRVELHLENGAVLRASKDQEEYEEVTITGEHGAAAGGILLSAKDQQHVAVTGLGTIDGQGSAFMDGFWTDDGPYILKPKAWRPRSLGFVGCNQVTIRDVTFRDSAQWTVHLTGCEDVIVQGVGIFNGLDVPHCNGIVPDHSRNVRITGCHIESGDDCIALKNTKDYIQHGPCENIIVSDCTLVSTSSAIKIGTESLADFRDIVVTNCVIRRSHRGLSIHLRDPGLVENVLFSNCTVETRLFHDKWWGRGEPIYVTALPRHDGHAPGRVRRVRFQNILCRSEHGVFIAGSPNAPIQDLSLDGVRVEINEWSRWRGGWHDRRPMHGDEHGGLSPHPTCGVYVEHASKVYFHDVRVEFTGKRYRWHGHPLVRKHVDNMIINSCSTNLHTN